MRKMAQNWKEQPLLVRWLQTISKKRTRFVYRSAFRAYTQFTGMTAEQMIDEAIEDFRRGIKERKHVVKIKLLQFYQWLVNEYPVLSRGEGEHKIERKGVRSKTAHCWVNAVRSFYATYDITVKLKGRSALPPARVVNKRLELTAMDVKALVDHARNPRDRAIILTIFQSGMDVSTLCSLQYENVRKGLEVKEHPMKLGLFREKSGAEYYSFLGRDAINAINTYLDDIRSKGIELKPTNSLFIQQRRKHGALQPMETHLVQKVLRETAMRSGLVDGDMNGHDQNPCSPHALREAFSSIMISKGVPDSVVDFWLGHNIGEMAKAYKRQRFEDVKQLYSEREQFISITFKEPSVGVKEIKEKYHALNEIIVKQAQEISKLRGEMHAHRRAIETITEENATKIIKLETQLAEYIDWDIQEQRRKEQEEYASDPEAFMEKHQFSEKDKLELRKIQEKWIKRQPWLREHYEKTKKKRAGKKTSEPKKK